MRISSINLTLRVVILSTFGISSYLYMRRPSMPSNLKGTTPLIANEEVIDESANVKTSFEEFGFKNLSMLKPLKFPRPYFSFTLTPWRVSPETPSLLKNRVINMSMVVVIKSDYRRSLQRNRVRKTWGSIRYVLGLRTEIIFAVAQAKNAEEELAIHMENSMYGDMLQVNNEENYDHIGIKALAGMQWVWQSFPEDWIYSSADDDIIPDVLKLRETIVELKQNLTSELNNTKHWNSTTNESPYFPMLCSVRYRMGDIPVRNKRSKWVVGKKMYPFAHYPPFCLGGFYSMPVKLSNGIFAVSRHFPYLHIDDVWLTGFMRLKLCDVYDKTDFIFNKTEINCAISTIETLDFEHVRKDEENLFMRKWIHIENEIMKKDDGVVKT